MATEALRLIDWLLEEGSYDPHRSMLESCPVLFLDQLASLVHVPARVVAAVQRTVFLRQKPR